jgi:hypothetical protein
MELIVEPDVYSPGMDEKGNYVDRIPSFNNLKNGLRCPCGSRKDKTYDCHTYFASHLKTKTHSKWLQDMNVNKANFFTENVLLKETISNQKLIIAKMEKEIYLKLKTIDYLTQQLANKDSIQVNDLIIFD